MRVLGTLSLTLLGLLCAAPAMAQQPSGAGDGRILSSSALDAAVAGHESAVDQDRTRLAELLARPDVRDIARDRGIDMGRVESVAAGLSDGEVRGIAPLVAKAAPPQDRGGLGTITVSVAAVVIILLLLILLT